MTARIPVAYVGGVPADIRRYRPVQQISALPISPTMSALSTTITTYAAIAYRELFPSAEISLTARPFLRPDEPHARLVLDHHALRPLFLAASHRVVVPGADEVTPACGVPCG